ncbi:hypothetical protein B0I35DRAFT_77160 [Stachybotrys elegans]|uniref:Uncharacterized protein n=1 Tax=Stachybotrys elegans TaxID=80388 RepID=A0A8K0WMB4_9HYPO|nr:hypothetical protein B0I35DRAFT_77160 [Stachybotrys elegans]
MPSHPSQQPLDDSWDLFKAVCHMSICAIAALSLVETKESPHVCIGCAEPTDSSRELMGLRDGIKAILMKQDLFTSHVFATDSEKLFAEIQTVLERLDDLICGETLSPDDSGVSQHHAHFFLCLNPLPNCYQHSYASQNLPKFGKLKELRRRWEADHGAMGSNDRPALGASADSMATASSTEPDPVSCDSVSRETPSSQNASQEMGGNTSPSASTAASLLIPLIDAIHDGRLQEILQSFEMVMDATIWGDTAPQTIEYQWHASSNGQDCLSKQAHNFGLACVRLFVEPPDDVPAEVEVHLNGFQNDTLMMNTCSPKDGNNVPVQTMHKGISHPPSSLHWRGISYIMGGWNGLPCRTLSSLIGDQSFTLRLRYSTAILLVASTFLLGTGPWLANPPTLDSFLVPWPSGDVRSWCPRVHHAFGGTEDARPHCLDGDQAAALGIIILELYTNRITDWQDADVDPICLTMSHRVRLARVLTSSVDDITPDLVACARACLDFDRLVEDIGHEKSDIPVEQRKLIIVYESILQPLSYEATRQSPKLCVDLQPVLKHLHLDNMERMRKGVSVR